MTDNSAAPLWSYMMELALETRAQRQTGEFVVARSSLDTELTPFGLLRWYLHPKKANTNTTAFYFFELEIPAGSKSGAFRHQGGIVHFVIEGQGYSMVGEREVGWKVRDALGVPTLPDGQIIQHFNTGSSAARLIVAFPNWDSALGPDLGVAMEVVEHCPEYAAQSGEVTAR